MEITELSLAPRRKFGGEKGNINSSSSESENNFTSSRKRKFFSSSESSVDLHVKDPLPMDWEQCLDLESGRMYYLNRKTLRKSWNWPIINKDHHHHHHQKLDLELHISAPDHQHHHHHHHHHHQDNNNYNYKKQTMMSSSSTTSNNNNNDNMVALACLNCHLLVILSRTSPSCPNCKYVHSLPLISSNHQPPLPKISAPNSKSLHTLSLMD